LKPFREIQMIAVVRTGGKQYQVSQGAIIEIERLSGENASLDKGEKLKLEDVLLVADGDKINVGQPLIKGAYVNVEILGEAKTKKVVIFKKLKRQGKQLNKGHRQKLLRVRVQGIVAG
jgi:large subunit ribosomal protein L21